MSMHEAKSCPRCGQSFECKPGTITECQCYGIAISADMRKLLDQRYTDCLCKSCLEFLQQDVNRFKEQYFLK